jgi:hypothetical protein
VHTYESRDYLVVLEVTYQLSVLAENLNRLINSHIRTGVKIREYPRSGDQEVEMEARVICVAGQNPPSKSYGFFEGLASLPRRQSIQE